jgi:biopolymer transport protein TolR
MMQLDEHDGDIGSVNVTPLIDVALVLVLVFLVTSPLMVKSLLPVELPKAVTMESEDQENLTISMSPTEGYALNEVPLRKEALENELKRAMKKSGIKYVLIRADESVAHGDVDDVMKMARRQKAQRISFATLPK